MRIGVLLAITALSITPALAHSDEIKSTPYVANYQIKTYNLTMNKTSLTDSRITYDGHGNTRWENLNKDGSVSLTCIYLHDTDSDYQLVPKQKLALASEQNQHCQSSFIQDWIKEPPTPELVAVGARNVSGHPSHGYKGKGLGVDGEIWIADDLRIPVLIKSELPNGNGHDETKLVNYRTAEPMTAIALPADYKRQDFEENFRQTMGPELAAAMMEQHFPQSRQRTEADERFEELLLKAGEKKVAEEEAASMTAPDRSSAAVDPSDPFNRPQELKSCPADMDKPGTQPDQTHYPLGVSFLKFKQIINELGMLPYLKREEKKDPVLIGYHIDEAAPKCSSLEGEPWRPYYMFVDMNGVYRLMSIGGVFDAKSVPKLRGWAREEFGAPSVSKTDLVYHNEVRHPRTYLKITPNANGSILLIILDPDVVNGL